MGLIFRISVVIIILLCTCHPPAIAAEEQPTGSVEKTDGGQRVSLFLGNTQDGSENGLSVGLEYESRWTQRYGVGVLAEYAGGDHDSWVVGIPFFLHPHAGWFVRLAPGLEFEDSDTSFLLRAGVGYDFEIMPRWSLAPEFNLDWTEGGDTKAVYGLSLSREF